MCTSLTTRPFTGDVMFAGAEKAPPAPGRRGCGDRRAFDAAISKQPAFGSLTWQWPSMCRPHPLIVVRRGSALKR